MTLQFFMTFLNMMVKNLPSNPIPNEKFQWLISEAIRQLEDCVCNAHDGTAIYTPYGEGQFVLRGQIGHLPQPEEWEKTLTQVELDTYQNGAYWGTASGWMAHALWGTVSRIEQENFPRFNLRLSGEWRFRVYQ